MCVRRRKQTTHQNSGFPLLDDTLALHRMFRCHSPFLNLPLKLHYSQDILEKLVLGRVVSYVNKECTRVLLIVKHTYFMLTITYLMPVFTFKVTWVLGTLDTCKLYEWTSAKQGQQQLKTFANTNQLSSVFLPFKAYFHRLAPPWTLSIFFSKNFGLTFFWGQGGFQGQIWCSARGVHC